MRSFRIRIIAPASLVAALILTGCSSSSSESSTATSTTTSTTSTTVATTTTDAAQGNSPTRCTTSDLEASVVGTDAGAGNRYTTVALQLRTSEPACDLYGFPGMAFYNDGTTVASTVQRDTTLTPTQVQLQPGQRAYFDFHYTVVENSAAPNCPSANRVFITPPDDTQTLQLPLEGAAIAQICSNGAVDVSPVRAAPQR